MYSPSFYREERTSLTHDLIHEFPFATLLSLEGEQISHLPLLLEQEGRILSGHMARANPHWRELDEKSRCKILFQGPHAYVSPAWYEPKPSNVPTWNYAVVHVTGQFERVTDPTETYQTLERLVNRFETQYQTGWQLPRGEAAIEELMKGIVAFRISELKFEGKFKLSQKLSPVDRENVIAQFRATDNPALVDLAGKMALTREQER